MNKSKNNKNKKKESIDYTYLFEAMAKVA